MAHVRIAVTDKDGTVLDLWERELPQAETDVNGPRLARLAVVDLADDIRGGIE